MNANARVMAYFSIRLTRTDGHATIDQPRSAQARHTRCSVQSQCWSTGGQKSSAQSRFAFLLCVRDMHFL